MSGASVERVSGVRLERAVVIGVGSPHGDDAVGLRVAERLAARLAERQPAWPEPGSAPPVRVVARDRPGPELVDDLCGAELAIVVDAMRTGGAPGRVAELAPDALASGAALSTHGFGVAHALRLADALGRTPVRVRLVGVEVERLEGELSPRVAAAVDVACARVLACLARELAGPGQDPEG
jgi:hydrogenase maturation protease